MILMIVHSLVDMVHNDNQVINLYILHDYHMVLLYHTGKLKENFIVWVERIFELIEIVCVCESFVMMKSEIFENLKFGRYYIDKFGILTMK